MATSPATPANPTRAERGILSSRPATVRNDSNTAGCELGHDVRLIAAQYVKPFLKGHKNDYRDAEAMPGSDITSEVETSVATGRTMGEIAAGKRRVWHSR